jgi:hypothetical protein
MLKKNRDSVEKYNIVKLAYISEVTDFSVFLKKNHKDNENYKINEEFNFPDSNFMKVKWIKIVMI